MSTVSPASLSRSPRPAVAAASAGAAPAVDPAAFRFHCRPLCAEADGAKRGAAGRVSMDWVILDIGAADLAPGDLVERIGPHGSLARMAVVAGAAPSEILAALGQRFERRHVEGAFA